MKLATRRLSQDPSFGKRTLDFVTGLLKTIRCRHSRECAMFLWSATREDLMRLHTVLSFTLLASLLAGCNLPKNQGIKIGVPFRSQENFNYCGAASVQMWRAKDGLSPLSQATIFTWMSNYYPACGSNQAGITAAVNNFTVSGGDAYWDYAPDTEFQDMIARQISSMDSRVPVIAVVNYDHTGVLNGGKWHQEGNYNIWDFVYFHDPAAYSNVQYSATDWMRTFCPGYWGSCDQILSSSASITWAYNLQNHGTNLEPGGGGIDPRDDWPPVY